VVLGNGKLNIYGCFGVKLWCLCTPTISTGHHCQVVRFKYSPGDQLVCVRIFIICHGLSSQVLRLNVK
jgi:hypothetical protein